MRSARCFWGSALLLLAIPAAVLMQALFGIEAELLFHWELALGLGLILSTDFKTPSWVTLIGSISTTLLILIFTLQGLAPILANETVNWLAFGILGQLPESLLIDLLFVWMIGVLLTDSSGKSRIFGFVCLTLAVGLKIYSYILPMLGTTLDEKYPALKMLLLTPFLWLMLESRKRPVRPS